MGRDTRFPSRSNTNQPVQSQKILAVPGACDGSDEVQQTHDVPVSGGRAGGRLSQMAGRGIVTFPTLYEPQHEKIGLRVFRPGPTQTACTV